MESSIAGPIGAPPPPALLRPDLVPLARGITIRHVMTFWATFPARKSTATPYATVFTRSKTYWWRKQYVYLQSEHKAGSSIDVQEILVFPPSVSLPFLLIRLYNGLQEFPAVLSDQLGGILFCLPSLIERLGQGRVGEGRVPLRTRAT